MNVDDKKDGQILSLENDLRHLISTLQHVIDDCNACIKDCNDILSDTKNLSENSRVAKAEAITKRVQGRMFLDMLGE